VAFKSHLATASLVAAMRANANAVSIVVPMVMPTATFKMPNVAFERSVS
jgi:hypothetical protein